MYIQYDLSTVQKHSLVFKGTSTVKVKIYRQKGENKCNFLENVHETFNLKIMKINVFSETKLASNPLPPNEISFVKKIH